jgi:hypothetical protein
MESPEMDQMECVCGEVLTGVKEKRWEPGKPKPEGPRSQLWDQFRQHMLRPDHQPGGAQWVEAYRKTDMAQAKAKSAQRAAGV